jgi:hypothetical protein
MNITPTSWLAIATIALALITFISIILSMHENKKNHKITILMKRAEGFYSKLFFILQSVGYDDNSKNNLLPMVLNLCASSSMLLGNGTKNAMDRFIMEVNKVPPISDPTLNIKCADIVIGKSSSPEIDREILNQKTLLNNSLVVFIKELVNSGKKEYNKILKDIWRLSGISSEQDFEPSLDGLNDLLNKLNGESN